MSLDHCHRYLDGDLNVLLAEVGDVHVDNDPPLSPPQNPYHTLAGITLCTSLDGDGMPKEACTKSQHKTLVLSQTHRLWRRCLHHGVRGATGCRMSVWIHSTQLNSTEVAEGAPLLLQFKQFAPSVVGE